MNSRAGGIAARREALQRRCAVQREQLTASINALESRLSDVDRATLVVRKLRLAPILLAVITTAAAATPLFRNISRGLTIVNALGQLLRFRRLGAPVVQRDRESKHPRQLP